MFSSFIGHDSIQSTQPLLHLFRIDLGIRHVSMQLSRTFSGLTNLLFNRRNEDEVTDGNRKRLKPGNVSPRRDVTTEEINEAVHNMIIENGDYPSPLGYGGFPKSVCTSVNECICHGIPDSRPLEDGDIINIDVTVYLNVSCLLLCKS
ncbi:hypothetical protein Rs2_37286 [Raphanus sativus]|nr:hypothetical protein Rs2_37286 [Raphanus sativus]